MIKTAVFFGPFVIIAVFAGVYVYSPDYYILLVEEDGISENAQAAAYFFASIVGAATAIRLGDPQPKNIFWLCMVFAFGTLIIGFEEISWGQRIVGFTTPAIIESVNTQSEFTAHNIGIVEERAPLILVSIGLYGGIAWLITFLLGRNATKFDWLKVIIPEWYLSLYFLSVAAFNVYRWYLKAPGAEYFINEQIGFWRHQELFELLLALGFLFVAVSNYKKLTTPM